MSEITPPKVNPMKRLNVSNEVPKLDLENSEIEQIKYETNLSIGIGFLIIFGGLYLAGHIVVALLRGVL